MGDKYGTNNKDDVIKKYPVLYQGEEYEIRIEKYYVQFGIFDDYIVIYKVTKHKNWFGKEKINYKEVDKSDINIIIADMSENMNINKSDENYYIELFKTAFNWYSKSLKRYKKIIDNKNKQLAALKEWNGVIE